MKRRSALLYWGLVGVLLLGASVSAEFLRGQSVTWSDFSHIRQIAASMSHVYFLTTSGITVYNKLEDRWEEPLTMAGGLDEDDLKQVWVDHLGDKLYVETSLGFFEYDMLFEAWFGVMEVPEMDNPARHIRTPSIMYPPPGFNFDGETERFIDFWGRYFSIVDVLDDGAGELWIGTWGYGVLTAGSLSHFLELLPYGLVQDRVNAIYLDDGVLWVSGAFNGDFRAGLTSFDPESGEFNYIESGVRPDFPAADINCLAGDKRNIYIGTTQGLLVLDRQTERISRQLSPRDFPNSGNILSILVTGDTLFAGTADGLAIITLGSDSTQVVRPTQFFDAIIYDIELKDNSVWIASSRGSFRLKLKTGELQRYLDPELVLAGDVYDIEAYGRYLWFLADGGLVRLNTETAEAKAYHQVVERLAVTNLAVNDTIAVIGSEKGFTILFHANDPVHTRDFSVADGLPSNHIYSLVLDGDYLWLGSDRGLTRFLWNNSERID